MDRGLHAASAIEKSTGRMGVVQVWELDLASFESVKRFVEKTKRLDRLDVVVANAGIATPVFEEKEGCESTVTVNVLGTFLMALGLLPKLRETASKHAKKTTLSVVTSDAHQMYVLRSEQG